MKIVGKKRKEPIAEISQYVFHNISVVADLPFHKGRAEYRQDPVMRGVIAVLNNQCAPVLCRTKTTIEREATR